MIRCLLTNNACYKANKKINPKGIVIHSTGCNNPNIKRYVQGSSADADLIGKNSNGNHWNRPDVKKCVHAFIGRLENGDVDICQTLDWNTRCWGCGSGKKGSYNNTHIQFEVCEDDLKSALYFQMVYDKIVELCAYLVGVFNISLDNVVSHHEAYSRGYASNHADIDHWLKRFGLTMDDLRSDIFEKLRNADDGVQYKVKVTTKALNIRQKPDTKSLKTGCIRDMGVYAIVETIGNWGKLKSGQGWICLAYTTKKI